MVVYSGGKCRLGKRIYSIIKEYEEKLGCSNNSYLEPFCGMLGSAIHAITDNRKVILSDKNKDLILLWKALQNDWIPPKDPVTKEEYYALRDSKEHSAYRAFIGISCAYSGIFFAGYRTKDEKSGQNFYKRCRNGVLDYGNKIKNVKNNIHFSHKDYTKLKPKGRTIYCDPPYIGNGFRSEHFRDFDHSTFWDVMRKWSKDNLVFVSEYEAPDDFVCVWKQKTSVTHSSKSRDKTEKLFVHKNIYNKIV